MSKHSLKAYDIVDIQDYRGTVYKATEVDAYLEKLDKFMENLRWRECNEDGTPKEDYEGQDWVLVKFKEKDTGYELIPRVAEFRRHKQKWRPINNEEDPTYLKYLDELCVAVSWREIEPDIPKEPEGVK